MAGNAITQLIIQGINNTKAAFDQINKDLGGMSRQVNQVGGAIAAKLSVDAFRGLIEGSARSLAELTQMASVSGTSVQRFQELAYGARSVGIEQEKLGDIFKDVQDKVGDFISTGGGELKDFFTIIAPQVGVTAAEFRNLSGPDALQLYVSSLEKANLSQSEMTFYLEAIANDASRLLPLMRNNGQAFAELSAQAREMGLILDQDAAEGARKLSASVTTMTTVSDTFSQRMAIAVSPALVEMTGLMLDYNKESKATAETTSVLGTGLKLLATVGIGIATIFTAAGKSLGAMAAGYVSLLKLDPASAMDAFAGAINDPIAEYEKGMTRIANLWNGEYARAGAEAVETQKRLAESQRTGSQASAGYARVTQESLTKVRTAQAAVTQAIQEAISKQQALETEATGKIKTLKEQQLEIYKRYRDRIKEFASGAQAEQPATYAAAADLKVQARAAAAKGDIETTQKLAEQAYDILVRLKQAGGGTYGLQGFIKELQGIEVTANTKAQGLAQQKATDYQAQIDKLKADLAQVKQVKVDVILNDSALAQVQSQLEAVAAKLKAQFQIPVTVNLNAAATPAAAAAGSTPGFSGGGRVRGPGTSRSDSILARLSDGEFVVRAAAVRHYGAAALERLNGLAMPKFAEGGLVAAAGSAGPAAAQGRPVLLELPGFGRAELNGDASVVDSLEKHFRITALKRGSTSRKGRP